MHQELRYLALQALAICDPQQKVAAVKAIDSNTPIDTHGTLSAEMPLPGRPAKPVLIPAQNVKMRSVHSLEGKIALLHAIAHIEFNAINLALDIIWRYPNMPEDFYRDWLKVAKEEAYHFSLLRDYLNEHDADYGDIPAHNGLWYMAEKTQDDLLARLAMVPRTLESRGLDVSPAIRSKLANINDIKGMEIIDIILRDEITHVETGNRWFNYVCQQNNQPPLAYYDHLFDVYEVSRPKSPFNIDARKKGGFTDEEIQWLEGLK